MVVKGQAGVKPQMVDGEVKASAWKSEAEGTIKLKSMPGASMTAEQRQQKLAQIKGQVPVNSLETQKLKDDLKKAEIKSTQLESERDNLAEQLEFMRKQQADIDKDQDYKSQLQSMLSQKQHVQDQLAQVENDLSRTTKDRDKQKLLVSQNLAQIEDLKNQIRAENDASKALQNTLSDQKKVHKEEVWNLKQDLQREQADREAERAKLEERLAEETANLRDGQVKVQQLVAELELSNQKINRLNVESSAHASSVE